jgi:DNA polymerase V
LKLADADPHWVRKQFNVVLERTVRELNGQPCLSIEDISPNKKQIMSSCIFRRIVNSHSG